MLFCIFLTSYVFLLRGVSGVDTVEVSVMEGDSVTLYTGVQTNQQENITFFFNTRIAEITEDLSKICTDDQCNEGTERFGDRLKLDHQTGSLTIMNIRNTDSGLYQLQVIGSNGISEKIFNFSLYERHYLNSVKVGESVTLFPGEIKHHYNVMKWYFDEILIAEITGDQSKICTDDQCDERFRDRLKLDHRTGSLTVMGVTTRDVRAYKLQIKSSSFSIYRHYSIPIVVLCYFPNPRADAVIAIGFILLVTAAAAIGVCCYRLRRCTSPAKKYIKMMYNHQENVVKPTSVNQNEAPLVNVAEGMSQWESH